MIIGIEIAWKYTPKAFCKPHVMEQSLRIVNRELQIISANALDKIHVNFVGEMETEGFNCHKWIIIIIIIIPDVDGYIPLNKIRRHLAISSPSSHTRKLIMIIRQTSSEWKTALNLAVTSLICFAKIKASPCNRRSLHT